MSKRLVDEAVELYRSGDLDAASSLLAAVESNYVQKRLRYLISNGAIETESALAFWARAFPRLAPLRVDNLPAPNTPDLVDKEQDWDPIVAPSSGTLVLSDPGASLRWLTNAENRTVMVDSFHRLEPWGMVALAALARADNGAKLKVRLAGSSSAGRFAYALGLADVVNRDESHGMAEADRTVKLRRINSFAKIEPVARHISHLLVTADEEAEETDYYDREEVRQTIYYVLVELMRNVLQHSDDPLGGIVVAQSMERTTSDGKQPAIQVAVADCGAGIHATLRGMHSEITSPAMALERAIWPYISGTFDSTRRGTSQNAGLGLFFVSEMAKLSGGRLLVSSRGASLFLQGDEEGVQDRLDLMSEEYPGTLVVFEIPKRGIADYHSLIQTITSRASERAARRDARKWIRYDAAPAHAYECLVTVSGENTVIAEEFAKAHLIPRLERGEPVVLNFTNIVICTQSYIHALLFDALRVAWQRRAPLYVKKVKDPVRDGLTLLESYALGEEE